MGGAHHGAVRRLRRPLQLLVCVLQSGLGPGDVVLLTREQGTSDDVAHP